MKTHKTFTVMVVAAMMLCLLCINHPTYAKGGETPYQTLLNLLKENNYETNDINLATVLTDSQFKSVVPQLVKAMDIKDEVHFPQGCNISVLLTKLMKAKYGDKSDKKTDFYKIQYSLDPEDFKEYVEKYPKSKFISEAEARQKCAKQWSELMYAKQKSFLYDTRKRLEDYANKYYYDAKPEICTAEGYEPLSKANYKQAEAIGEWLTLLKSEQATKWLTNGNIDCTVYSNYLDHYGNYSVFADEANDSVRCCNDRNAWQIASEQGTIEAYQVYVSDFPKGIHSRYAQRKVNDWSAWKTAREKDCYSGYLEYYKNYPNGDSVAVALMEIIPNEDDAVDLGLPSGTRWAPFNVGAYLPEECGDYYAWGETKTKNDFSWDNYQYFTDKNRNGKPWSGEITDVGEIIDIGNDISGTEYDVAHVKWGGSWKLPTKAQCQELVDKCKWTWWVTPDLQEGYKVTGPNGNSIFLPAAGYRHERELARANFRGGYWTSNRDKSKPFNSYLLRFKEYDAFELNPVLRDVFANSLRYGRTVRPVTTVKPKQLSTKQIPSFPIEKNNLENTPVINISGHNAVDLGLPSGTKWADCNMGSSSPADYGDYYAWGETNTKKTYAPKTYKYYIDKDKDGYFYGRDEEIDIGSEISGTEYDVAHVKWGGSWKMPTKRQWQELIDRCTWKFTALNGHKGYLVTGPNGRSIFLPAAGDKAKTEYGETSSSIGQGGEYWSSTKGQYGPYELSFKMKSIDLVNPAGCFGKTVRPVAE